MNLTGAQKRFLRGAAHHLDPVVLVGQHGVTDPVVAKVSTELERHELIKVQVSRDAPDKARVAAEGLADRTGAALVQVIGHRVVLYRRRKKDPAIVLPA